MMKSFFKKLAFVMALAMVVTLAAPAAQASALNPLTIALQSATAKEEAITEYKLEVGASENFKYYYAPKNYLELHPTWESSNTDVAIVDKDGIVTGLKDGVATIAIKLDNGQFGTLEVTVGKGEVPTDGFVAKQTTDNDIQLTFNNKAITKDEIAKNLKMFYVVSGYDVEVQLIKKIGDVKDGVTTVEIYGEINDGSEYKFDYKGETSSFLGQIGAVASIETKVAEGKYVGDDIKLDVVYKNAAGIDITAVVNKGNGYVTYETIGTAPNNEYWLSDNILYFTTEYYATVKAFYHGYDANNNELTPIKSDPLVVTATNKPPYTLDFTANPTWTLATEAKWDKVNKDIAVGDDDKNYTLFVKTKEAHTKAEVTFPTVGEGDLEFAEGTFRYESTKPSVLYVTDAGLVVPNSQGSASVLLYFKPKNGAEKLVTVVPVKVDEARSVKNVVFDGNASVTLSTVKGYNKATFTLILKDNLKTPFEGATVTAKCTTNAASGLTAPTPVVKNTSDKDGKVTIEVVVGENMVADAGTTTYRFEATVNGITKPFSVTVKDPKGTPGHYQNLSYGLNFNGDKAIKVENTNALTLKASLAVLSNSAAVGDQELAGPKVDITEANIKDGKVKVGDFYYEVKFNNTNINNKVTTTATNTVLNIPLTTTSPVKTASGSSVNVIDYNAGVGTYTVTIYKAMEKTNAPGVPAYYTTVRTLTQEVKYNQPALECVGEITNETNERQLDEIVKKCFKFQYDKKDITNFTDYIIDVDANKLVEGSAICYINSVTFYKKVGENTYVKYTVAINDYVTLK